MEEERWRRNGGTKQRVDNKSSAGVKAVKGHNFDPSHFDSFSSLSFPFPARFVLTPQFASSPLPVRWPDHGFAKYRRYPRLF